MEADWEFEIGGDAPVIEAHWTGFVDLRAHPERVSDLNECRELPALAGALVKLNSADSPVWTSKTDVFVPEDIDADEMNSPADEAAHAVACYIDLLPRSEQRWNIPAKAEWQCRDLCAGLRVIELARCRVDLVVRKAVVAGADDLGITAYFTACGATPSEAKAKLGECLGFMVGAVVSCERQR